LDVSFYTHIYPRRQLFGLQFFARLPFQISKYSVHWCKVILARREFDFLARFSNEMSNSFCALFSNCFDL
jgi:hypothetical protein